MNTVYFFQYSQNECVVFDTKCVKVKISYTICVIIDLSINFVTSKNFVKLAH